MGGDGDRDMETGTWGQEGHRDEDREMETEWGQGWGQEHVHREMGMGGT